MKREPEGCGNCGGPTENEPMAICDECDEAIRIGDRLAVKNARREGAEAAMRWAWEGGIHGEKIEEGWTMKGWIETGIRAVCEEP